MTDHIDNLKRAAHRIRAEGWLDTASEIDAAAAELERLQTELREVLESLFYSNASEENDGPHAGWFDTMAMSDAKYAGESLVAMGVFERHADGSGRRGWYRPLSSAEAARNK